MDLYTEPLPLSGKPAQNQFSTDEIDKMSSDFRVILPAMLEVWIQTKFLFRDHYLELPF